MQKSCWTTLTLKDLICISNWEMISEYKKIIFVNFNFIILQPNIMNDLYNITIEPQQLAEDYKILRNLLSKYERYTHSQLIGPSVTNPLKLKSLHYLKA